MVAKDIIYNENARKALFRGIEQIANAVRVTLGPKGKNVVLYDGIGSPSITNDGVTIAKEIELKDKFENIGVQLLKEVATKTQDVAGDGTTTATILAHAIIKEGLKNVTAGRNPIDIKKGIEIASKNIVDLLHERSINIEDKKMIKQVATISSNNDEVIGELIANAMERVGKDGIITVEEAKSLDTNLEVVEGMQFDRGYLSPYMVTNPESMSCELENPYILVTDKKITAIKDLLPILESISQEGRPLLIISDDLEGEALATLTLNLLRGTLRVVAVKAPSFGDEREAMLEDISILTGSNFISETRGMNLEDINISSLGSVEKAKITKDKTTLIGGKGDKKQLDLRITQIKSQIESVESKYTKEDLEKRLARLSGGVAVLRIGAATETEMKEKKDRVDDALHATKAAVEEGIVVGGGVALLRLREELKNIKIDNEDERVGIDIVYKALVYPIIQIIENSGKDASIIIEKIRLNENFSFGYNAKTDQFEDLIEAGVIDPTKVTRSAVQNASSIAGLVLTTETIVAEVEEKNNDNGNSTLGQMPMY